MELKFTLTVEQTNVIMQCLGDGPYKLVAPVINEIQNQAQPQMQPQLVPDTKPKAEGEKENAS
jgi:hypothetical protein